MLKFQNSVMSDVRRGLIQSIASPDCFFFGVCVCVFLGGGKLRKHTRNCVMQALPSNGNDVNVLFGLGPAL